MGAEEIVVYGNDVLRAKAAEVEKFDTEIEDLIKKMYVIMAESNGLGLAAPQIGISKRLFTYDVGEGPHALLNPVITKTGGEETAIEGCLSIPGLQGEVSRYFRVTVTGIDETGNNVTIKAEGLLARVFQHEIDHLDGLFFADKADPDTLEMVSAEDEEPVE